MKDYVEKYHAFGKERPEEEQLLYHMNCAEALLRSANDYYGFELDEKSFKIAQAFGGGFYSGKTCGAFCGCLAALSLLFADERPSKQEQVKEAAQLMVAEFEKEFGSMDCKDIKKDFPNGCGPVKLKTADVFLRVIELMKKEEN